MSICSMDVATPGSSRHWLNKFTPPSGMGVVISEKVTNIQLYVRSSLFFLSIRVTWAGCGLRGRPTFASLTGSRERCRLSMHDLITRDYYSMLTEVPRRLHAGLCRRLL
ncbi:hypothetical protein C8Q79DRAFT_206697 [Trametes meyenii]|nr:hypothetical protein C8Q79DRAFT_206697 [Trametes meyenii]